MIPKSFIEEEAIKLVLSTKNHFCAVRKNMGYENEWKSCENAYFNGSASNYSGLACVRTGMLHSGVEAIVPKIDKVVFPPDGEFFDIVSKTPMHQVKQEEAEIAKILIAEQFYETKVREKLIKVSRDLCIYGTVFIKTWWREDRVPRYKRVFDGDKWNRELLWESVYSNPDFYSPLIFDVYADPKDENLEGSIIEKIQTTYQDLWANRERKENGEPRGIYNAESINKIKELFKDKDSSDSYKNVALNYTENPNKDVVNAYEYWGDVPLYFFTQKEEDRDSREVVKNALITIATPADRNDKETDIKNAFLLRISDNPFDHNEKPYIRARYLPINGRLYGLGLISRVTIPLEEEYNTCRTQIMDNRTFNLRPKWLKLKEAQISDSALQDLKHQIIETQDMLGLQALRPNDMTSTALASGSVIAQNIQDVTGASKFLSGTPTGGSLDRTAGGIAQVSSFGLERFELVVTTFTEELLKELVRHFWMLNQQFLQTGRDVRMIGEKFLKVNPAEIPFNFDVKFLGVKEIGEKTYKVNELNILIQNIMPFAQLGLDPLPVLFRMLKLMGQGDLIEQIDKRPESQLEFTPEGEAQLLMQGNKVRIDLNDDHQAFIEKYLEILAQPDIPENVRKNTTEVLGQRQLAIQLNKLVLQRIAESPNNA